jgi:hypothetical protein
MTSEEKKKYAALCYALGLTRGMLFDVLNGEADPARLRQVYDSSATNNVARAIGMTEADLTLDWNDHLTEPEKWIIGGTGDA